MSSDADTARMADSGTRAPLRWLTVAAAQACLIAGLAWLWSTGSSDAAATSVDWEFVSLVAVTPLSLAASGWIGWRAHKPAGADQAGPIGGLATVTQWLTLGLLVLTLPIAPLVIFGAVIFGPMG